MLPQIFRKTSRTNIEIIAVEIAAHQYWRYSALFKQKMIAFGIPMRSIQVWSKTKIFKQSCTKYLEAFSRFNTPSFYQKWHGTRLLPPWCQSSKCLKLQVTEHPQNKDLLEWKNFLKIYKIKASKSKYLAGNPIQKF